MGKDKKGKKGKQEEDFGEEEVDVESAKGAGNDNASGNAKVVRKGKKGRKKDDWEEDVAKELEALSLDNNIASDLKSAASKNETEDKKLVSDEPDFSFPSKKEKKKKKEVEFEGEDADEEIPKTKQSKNQRGKKGKNEGSDEDNEDFKKDNKGARKKGKAIGSEDEGEDEMINGKLSKKQKGKKSKPFGSDEEDTPMQKKDNKGSKKKSKVVISDDEESTEQTEKIQPKKQRSRKGKGDFSDEEVEHMMEQKKDSKVNKKKGGKGKGDISTDEDETDDADIKTRKQKDKVDKVKKKGKKSKNKVVDSDDEDDEEPALKGKTSKKDSNVGKIKPKTGFQLLETEDMDLDDDSNDDISLETETIAASEKDTMLKNQLKQDSVDIEDQDIEVKKDDKGSKKSKKKERRKKEDEEEVDKMLEELAMEIEGKKPPEKVKEKAKDGTEDTVAEGELKPEEISEKQSKKKKKKKGDLDPQEEKNVEDKESQVEETVEEEDRTVKTAAQKKKEKKERERQKKLAQNEQDRSKKKCDAKTEETKLDDRAEKVEKEDTEALAVLDEDDADDKKKKKKKKKDEEEKKDKKRPGRKQIAAMQEALKKVKEEEERLRLEEEAKQKAAEEAEQKRQEKLRLEQERKEKKKQKEKEKRERLKAEGKLLTRSQRQARARMEATLQALRQQGVEVPQIGEKKERAPRLGDRKRSQKKKVDEQDSTVELQKVEVEIIGPSEQKVELPEHEDNALEKENKETINDIDVNETLDTEVKEAWDETTEDEGEGDDEDDENILSKAETKVVKNVSKQPKKEESEEETEESESEEESSTEKSESEEESSDESEEEEGKKQEAKIKERAAERIMRRREEAEKNRSTSKLRSPVVCVLGHVDTGKTKILDKIRRTHVQDSEAGGITQQIGATMVPQDALKDQCKMVKNFADVELKVPGLLIIDTPGHESFSNLRSRGSSLCDIAILVVDIMHGLEPQTIESLNLLKQKKTPFIVALNKVDRLYEWKTVKNKDIQDVIKSQARNTKMEFEDRAKDVILQFANQGMNATLFYENKDPRSYISMVPTSAFTGDGMGNLMALIVELTQSMMAKRLAFSEELQATVLEVKAIPGLGTTIDVILVNGRLCEGDTILLAAHDGALVTQIRSLLMPQPLKELRVKNPYQEYKEVEGAQGVKIAGKDLDKAIAGLQLLVAHHPDEVEVLKDEVSGTLREAMSSIKLAERGVYVQASTLGSLEALLEFLKVSKIPYSGIRIGPVVKKDVMKASIMLEHDSQYAVILAFDVKVERDAQELADNLGVKIFQADIIYHLFDKFMAYRDELKQKKRDEFKNVAVFPCKLRILPQYVFNSRDPIVVGVIVEAGVIKDGTPLCVPSKEFLEIGTVTTIEVNHKSLETARRGQEVCIKIEPSGGEAPKMYGRHFDHTDMLVSKITRQSIDVCKEYFRDDLLKTDWQLMVELKKIFQIL